MSLRPLNINRVTTQVAHCCLARSHGVCWYQLLGSRRQRASYFSAVKALGGMTEPTGCYDPPEYRHLLTVSTVRTPKKRSAVESGQSHPGHRRGDRENAIVRSGYVDASEASKDSARTGHFVFGCCYARVGMLRKQSSRVFKSIRRQSIGSLPPTVGAGEQKLKLGTRRKICKPAYLNGSVAIYAVLCRRCAGRDSPGCTRHDA